MPRSKISVSGRILDYFRHAEAGEVKVVHQLATDIVRERFAAPKAAPKVRKVRKAAPAAQSTEETQQ